MLNKKSIVLSSLNKNSSEKAVLTLQEDGEGVSGNLRLYNFSQNLCGISSLGVYVGQKVYKAGLTLKSNMLYQFFISLPKIPNKFTCAVVNFRNAQPQPILYGASEGNNEEIYANIICELSKENTIKNTQDVLDKYGVDFADEEKENIEKEIDTSLCSNCENCVYKTYFYSQNDEKIEKNVQNEQLFKVESETEEQSEETPPAENESEFFLKLKPQIDKLFAENPLEETLQEMIPFSKFVKVEYEDDGDFYVFGLLYDENENVKFVCFGVPAVFEQEPPKELSGYPIWLPVGEEKEGFGYWLTYQDASTGEPVKAILE